MSGSSVLFDLSKCCPHIDCGQQLGLDPESPVWFCKHCGSDITICSVCGAANRPLASYCRGCGERTHSEASSEVS
jgi:hypothetical protein